MTGLKNVCPRFATANARLERKLEGNRNKSTSFESTNWSGLRGWFERARAISNKPGV